MSNFTQRKSCQVFRGNNWAVLCVLSVCVYPGRQLNKVEAEELLFVKSRWYRVLFKRVERNHLQRDEDENQVYIRISSKAKCCSFFRFDFLHLKLSVFCQEPEILEGKKLQSSLPTI